MSRNRRPVTVVLLIAAAIVAVVLWRSHRSGDGGAGSGSAAGKPVEARHGVASTPRPDPKTLARGTIAGTVTEDGKGPIAHAKVCADGESRELASELFRDSSCAETDAQGRYAIASLMPASYTVSASARTYRPGVHHPGGNPKRTDVRLAAGERKDGVDIALRPGGVELTGVVSDLTGGTIAHAKVWATAGGYAFSRSGEATAHTDTDDQGRFSLWVKPGPLSVTAAAEGYTDAEEVAHAPGKVELLLTPESSLSGTVADAETGKPVEGARVLVGTNEWGWESGETVFSDPQGKFRVTRLVPGRYVAVARTDRGYGRTEGSVLVGLGQHVEHVDVKLFGAARVEGKVVIAATKAPCEDGGVWLRERTRDETVTGKMHDGTVVVEGVRPGTYTVTAHCAGLQARDKYDPITVATKDVTGLVWEVDAGARIRGKVVLKSGEPVEDEHIWARSVGGPARDKTGWASASSARDGAYEVTGLRAGSYKLEVDGDHGVAPKDGFKVDVAAGATVEQDLVLDDGGSIRGTVVDGEGKPVAGVEVRAWPVAGDMRFVFGPAQKSDEAGAFAIDALRPGDYRVTAVRGWFDELRKPGTTDDAKQGERTTVRVNQTATVRIVVESQSGVIRGTVVDAAGAPVPDAYVSAARESDAAGARGTNVQDTRWTWDERPNLTTVEGAFTIGKLSPGKYTVRAYRKGGGEAVAEHVAVGTTAKLQIKATGSIEGLAKSAGGPPDELSVSLSDPKTSFERSDKFFRTAGKFTIRDLPAGHYTLRVEGGGASKSMELDLADGETKTGIVLELERLVSVTGRVVELGTTKPVPGMRMMAMTANNDFVRFRMDDEQDNITDETGRFTIKDVPLGKLIIRGFPKDFGESDYGPTSVTKNVDGSGTVDIGDLTVVKKRVKRGDPVGELGVRFVEPAPGAPPETRELKVSFIDPAGPAAKSGLVVGDVVVSVDGIDVAGAGAINAGALMRAPPGTKLALGLARKATVTITLAAP